MVPLEPESISRPHQEHWMERPPLKVTHDKSAALILENFQHPSILIHTLILTHTHTANKSKVLYGIPRDPDLAVALTQLEEEENENMDDEKPKVRELRHVLWYLLVF